MAIGQEIREEMQGDLVEMKDNKSKEKSESLTCNDHNRRVTDLAECSRVTLPIKEEAKIEVRREMHSKNIAMTRVNKRPT